MYLHNNHYDVITTMPGFLNRSYFCYNCRKAYDSTVDHLCKAMCKMCRALDCPFVEPQECADCGRVFRSQACYDRHKEPLGAGQSVCQQVKRCTECGTSVIVRNMPHHICGKAKCKTCKEFVANKDKDTHLCYIKRPEERDYEEDCDEEERKDKKEYEQLMFFDYECMQEAGTMNRTSVLFTTRWGKSGSFLGRARTRIL